MLKLKLALLKKISTPFIFFFILVNGCSGTKPLSIGQFAKCPDKPNCISSKSSNSLRMFPPLKYQGTQLKAKNNLLIALESMPRARVSMNTGEFLHIEFTSKIFRFVVSPKPSWPLPFVPVAKTLPVSVPINVCIWPC